MRNLEQVRASNALIKRDSVARSEREGDTLSGYPSLIINNGLLATLAFSLEKQGQALKIANAVAYHLANLPDDEDLVAPYSRLENGHHQADATQLRNKLVESDSYHLQRCTTESLAFVAYLKRFAA